MVSQQMSPFDDPDIEEEFHNLGKIVIENASVNVMSRFCEYGQMLSSCTYQPCTLNPTPMCVENGEIAHVGSIPIAMA